MSVIGVWAPNARQVRVLVDEVPRPMSRSVDGWWSGPDLPAGTDYAFLLDESEQRLPDPRSRWQPFGVHGPSRVYDQAAFVWHDADWAGRELSGGVIYELHVGTFTAAATFDGARERLDHLVRLGITHVEVLPVNAVNGVWNWGYDGVAWYAVHEPYGGPDAFKRFVDACHAHGLAVLLDVVYNHLGPSGNYLPRWGPYVKNDRNTWGEVVNLDEPQVRRFIIDNALMWLRDYHVDGLRLDAVHALQDSSPVHLLAELSAAVDDCSASLGRKLSLIAESDLNDPIMIRPRPDGYGLDAQWDDDVHHALHALLTGERQGYYCDFGSLRTVATVMCQAFWHAGTYSAFRGRVHGAAIDRARVAGWRLVVCLQNHDQVGNRAVGERLSELVPPALLRVGAVLLLTSPFTPMVWMGEEWAASTRWPFFSSHPEPELAGRAAATRIEEFAAHGWRVDQMIDPQDPAAYHGAVLHWAEISEPAHAEMLQLYRELIALRAAEADLADPDLAAMRVDVDEEARWLVMHRGRLRVAANLAEHDQIIPAVGGAVIFATAAATSSADGLRLAAQSAAIIASERS